MQIATKKLVKRLKEDGMKTKRAGKKIYRALEEQILKKRNSNSYVAINISTREYVFGKTTSDARTCAEKQWGDDSPTWIQNIGADT